MKPHTPFFLALGLLTLGGLTGCYTQLATRGYGTAEAPMDQGAAQMPGNSTLEGQPGDSAMAGLPAGEADTLAPKSDAPTVVVNNYYDTGPSYRGYANWEWDFPALSFGYYSSRYGHYSRPYWWDDPFYSRRRPRGYHSSYYPPHRPARPISGGTLSGPYKSRKRLFNPEPDYPALQKGRRGGQAAPAAAPQVESSRQAAPKQADQGSPQASQPASANPPASSSGSGSSGGSSSESKPAKSETKSDGNYPALKKGRR